MGYWCHDCKDIIAAKVYDYSIDNYGNSLCRKCQKNHNKVSEPVTYKGNNNKKKKSTPEAESLHNELIKRGVPAILEKWDGHKHIDIAVVNAKVNIEIDGPQHNFSAKQAMRDLKRTYHSFKKGYVTLRIPNELVTNHLVETADYITKFLNDSVDQLNSYEYD